MEQYDPAMAARVWQRVRGQQPVPLSPDLSLLAAEERQNAVTLMRLSRQFKGKTAAVLREMAQQEEEHARSLLENF